MIARTAFALALMSTSAMAGGYVPPVIEAEPSVAVIPAAPVGGWTGGYVGANINYGKAKVEAAGDLGSLLSDEGFGRTLSKPDGASAAVRAGYDWQAGRGVFGLGAEYNLAKYSGGLKGDFGAVADELGVDADIRIKNTATIFARAGYLVNDNLLAYGLLGYTRAKGEVSGTIDGVAERDSETLSGATFGLGAEYKFSPKMSAYAEYAYTDFGDVKKTDGNLEVDLSQIKLGVNYRF